MRIVGYLLDIDGTLLDSREAHTRAWQRTLAARGIAKNFVDIDYDFAAPDVDVVPGLFGIDEADAVNDITREKNEYFMEEIASVPLFPGAADVLASIRDSGGRICFVSSNFDRVIQRMFEAYGWETLGASFVGLDGVARAKPAPEMVLQALEKIGVEASASVMIGDSPADIEAGHAAGTWTVAVCSSGNTRAAFERIKPDLVFDAIADLLPMIPLEFQNSN
jgi:HAD superfamily hydrolase (TIGR01509 family)